MLNNAKVRRRFEERTRAILEHEKAFAKRSPAELPRRRLRTYTYPSRRVVARLRDLLLEAGFVARVGSREYDLVTDAQARDIDKVLSSLETQYDLPERTHP